MPLFPQSFIEDLRTQADIVAVVQDTVPLRRTGATYKGLCPFHGEKTPSFHVNRDRGFFHCFGCGVGGDVIKFVELRDRVAFAEAVRTLAQRFGLPVPESRDERGIPGRRRGAGGAAADARGGRRVLPRDAGRRRPGPGRASNWRARRRRRRPSSGWASASRRPIATVSRRAC